MGTNYEFFRTPYVEDQNYFDESTSGPPVRVTNVKRLKYGEVDAYWTFDRTLVDASGKRGDLRIDADIYTPLSLNGVDMYAKGIFDQCFRGSSVGVAPWGPSGLYETFPAAVVGEANYAVGEQFTVQAWFKVIDERAHVLSGSGHTAIVEQMSWAWNPSGGFGWPVYSDSTGWTLMSLIDQPAGPGTEQFMNFYLVLADTPSAKVVGYTGLSLTSSFYKTTDVWHHVLARRSKDNLAIFVDGRKSTNTTTFGSPTADHVYTPPPGQPLYVGFSEKTPTGEIRPLLWMDHSPYPGVGDVVDNDAMIDDVAIWNKALSDEEVAYLWNDGIGRPASDLPTLRAGMDTSGVDTFRQGIELTQMKHFDAGIVKIHAGEPGHVLRRNNVGEDRAFVRAESNFCDMDNFNPVSFIKVQEFGSWLTNPYVTFPIVVGDNEQKTGTTLDGIIEPLTIRAVADFTSLDLPNEAHDVNGCLMGGNVDTSGASNRVLSVDDFDPTASPIAFLDLVDMYEGGTPLNGYFIWDKVTLKPYDDSYTGRLVGTWDDGMRAVMVGMSGSTDNYISNNKRSSTCGWDYDTNVAVGTDSIAFGGMTH